MTRSRLVLTLSVTAAVGLSGLVACGRAADRSSDSTTTRSAEGETARTLMPSGPRIDTLLPGNLPANLDSISGSDFRTFVQRLQFTGGGTFKRPCTGNAGCDGPTPRDSASVSINAVRGQDSLPIATLPSNGTVAAELVNRGPLEERIYKLKSDSSRYRYYLVVFPGTSDTVGTWRLEELETKGNTASHRQIASGAFVACMHTFNPSGPRASFKSCADADREHQHSLRLAGSAASTYTSPPWVSCIYGCCSAQAS